MTGEEIAKRLIDDYRYDIRACIEADGDRYRADDQQWAAYRLIIDVAGMAYGFTDKEAARYVKILVGEV